MEQEHLYRFKVTTPFGDKTTNIIEWVYCKELTDDELYNEMENLAIRNADYWSYLIEQDYNEKIMQSYYEDCIDLSIYEEIGVE